MTTEIYGLLFGLMVLLSLLSILVVRLKLVPYKFVFPGLLCLVLLSLFLIFSSKPKLAALGLSSFSSFDVFVYGFVTLVSCLLVYFISKFVPIQRSTGKAPQVTIAVYVVLFTPAQEFIFRSFLYYSLSTIGLLNILSMTVISSLLFGIAHLGFEDKLLTYGAFILGGVWGLAYFIAPNLLLVSLSHEIIGLFALSQGLINQKTFLT